MFFCFIWHCNARPTVGHVRTLSHMERVTVTSGHERHTPTIVWVLQFFSPQMRKAYPFRPFTFLILIIFISEVFGYLQNNLGILFILKEIFECVLSLFSVPYLQFWICFYPLLCSSFMFSDLLYRAWFDFMVTYETLVIFKFWIGSVLFVYIREK